MWMAIIAATIFSLIGLKSLQVEAAVPNTPDIAMAAWLATDMNAYRFAVESFATRNSGVTGRVIPDAQDYPLGYVAPPVAMWTNEVCTNGMILIFAAIDPPVSGVTGAINLQAGSSPLLVQREALIAAMASSSAPVRDMISLGIGATAGKSAKFLHVPFWLGHRG